jgi:hypothetical protein
MAGASTILHLGLQRPGLTDCLVSLSAAIPYLNVILDNRYTVVITSMASHFGRETTSCFKGSYLHRQLSNQKSRSRQHCRYSAFPRLIRIIHPQHHLEYRISHCMMLRPWATPADPGLSALVVNFPGCCLRRIRRPRDEAQE